MNSLDREHIERLLFSYELGTLSEAEEEKFELVLLENSELFERVQELENATHLMRNDPDVRELLTDVLRDLEMKGVVPSSRKPAWKRIWPAYVAAAAVFLLFLFVDWRVEFHPSSEAIAAENRLAVMYFRDLSGQEADQEWSEIVTNLVITDLSESQYIQVISEERIERLLASSGQATSPGMELQAAIDAARASDARWLIVGEILQTQPALAISSQLIDMKSSDIVAAQLARGHASEDVFAVVDQLTAKIRNDISLPGWTKQETDPSVAEVTTHSPEAYRYFLAGRNFFSQFYYVEAWENFRKAVKIDSTFAIAYYYLHRLDEPGALEKAIRFIDRASQLDQAFIRAGVAISDGDYERAIADMERAVRRFPDYKEFYHSLGTNYRVLADYENAIRCFKKALEMDPLFKQAYNGLAYTYYYSGNQKLSLETVEHLVAVAPDEANSWDTKGEINAMLGRVDEAKAAFEKSLAIKPDFFQSAVSLSLLYLREGDYESAARRIESQSERRNIFGRSQLRTYFAMIFQARGAYRQALEYLQKSITTDTLEFSSNGFAPFTGEAKRMYLAQARIFTELGKRDAAIQAGHRVLDIMGTRVVHPIWRGLCLSTAQIFAVNGDSATVRSIIEQWKSVSGRGLDPTNLERHLAGALAFSAGNWESAIANLERACEEWYDSYSAFLLAQAYIQTGKSGLAIQLLQKALAFPDKAQQSKTCFYQAKMYYHLGRAYEQSGDIAQARTNFERFLELWRDADTGLPEVEQARERLSLAALSPYYLARYPAREDH